MRALLATLMLFTACSKSGGKHNGAPPPVAGAAQVLAAWQKSGLDTSGLAETSGDKLGFSDAKCRAGQIDGLDTTLCEFPDADAAKKAAESHGPSIVGDNTATWLTSGKVVLLISNRKGQTLDHDGKKFNQIAQTFRHANQN
jgi:hypothetical protein